MKKKGFTLIELIVVIAIIGVLAAILVPAMLGYVKKSKITTANTTAKSIYNAFNTALVDLDTQDVKIVAADTLFNGTALDGSSTTNFPHTVSPIATPSAPTLAEIGARVYNYFSDVAKVTNFQVQLSNGACVACGVLSGAYPGTYPKAMTVDAYANSTWTLADCITYAQS